MTNETHQTEKRVVDELVVRARCDRDAFGRLYERIYPPVFRYCIRRTGDRSLAEDIASTVFLSVARTIATFPGETFMKQLRDETEKRVRDQKQIRVRFADFQEFVALNRTLREEERTADVFVWLDKTDEEDAQRVFLVAQSALIKQRAYELCGKYIDSERDLSRIRRNYIMGLEMADKRFGAQHREFTQKKFLNDITTLVAILVQNDRKVEALEAAGEAKEIVKDPDLLRKLDKQMESALSGTVPKPWP